MLFASYCVVAVGPCSLFVVGCLLLLGVYGGLLFSACCLLVVSCVICLVFVVYCWMYAVSCLMLVDCCLVFGVLVSGVWRLVLFGGRCLFVVVC